jgi:hypothetical protein
MDLREVKACKEFKANKAWQDPQALQEILALHRQFQALLDLQVQQEHLLQVQQVQLVQLEQTQLFLAQRVHKEFRACKANRE